MKKLAILAAAVAIVVAPVSASAQDHHHHHRAPHAKHHPKGWGPHRGPDRRGYYHGYRGSREHHAGYRRGKDGLWYPAAAFAIGAIIGGALNQ